MSAHRNVADNSTANVNATLALIAAVLAIPAGLLRPDWVAWMTTLDAGWRIFLLPVSVVALLAVVWLLLTRLVPELRDTKPGRHRPDTAGVS